MNEFGAKLHRDIQSRWMKGKHSPTNPIARLQYVHANASTR